MNEKPSFIDSLASAHFPSDVLQMADRVIDSLLEHGDEKLQAEVIRNCIAFTVMAYPKTDEEVEALRSFLHLSGFDVDTLNEDQVNN